MALITEAARKDLIALTIGLFDAAPGQLYLNEFVTNYNAGATLSQLANILTNTGAFKTVYPPLQTAQEFAASLVDNLLGNEVTDAAAITWVKDWIVAKVNANVSKGNIILEAVQALRTTTNPVFANAKLAFENQITVAEYYSVTKEQSSTSLDELQAVLTDVSSAPDSVEDAKDRIDSGVVGQTLTLTGSVDSVNGGTSNDVINGILDGASTPDTATWTPLDTIDGGAGIDRLNIFDVDGGGSIPAGAIVTNVEVLSWISAGEADIDTTSNFTGLTKLTVTGDGGSDVVTASDVEVVGTFTDGGATVDGGSTQTITSIGGVELSGATGAIKVTDAVLGNGFIEVDDGTSVDITATTKGSGDIFVGGGGEPTGEIKIVENLNATGAVTGGTIDTTGGTKVSITVNATQATLGSTTTIGNIEVSGGTTVSTTDVTVIQTAPVAAVAAVAAVAGVTETASAVFGALTAGETVILGGLTFTAGAAGTTAAQTAAAFASLANNATQGSSNLGTYSGTFTGWSSGAVSTDTVVFTSSTASTNVADLADTGTAVSDTTITTVAGSAATKAVAGVSGLVNGVVTVNDDGADTITTVTISGYESGSSVTSDALTTLSLANAKAESFTVNNTLATTLGLTINNVTSTSTLNIGGTYQTLNATATGTSSKVNLTAGGLTTLALAGDKSLDLTGSTVGALTVTVSGSAGTTLDTAAGTLTTVNTSATTGANTFTIDGTKATYTGGAGVDTVTLSAVAPTKAISLGAGNDKLTLAAGTTSTTGALTGGDGTDTLAMAAADAATADDTALFASKVTGFEVLALSTVTTHTIDLVALGGYSNVTSAAQAAGLLTLDKMASGGTFTILGDSVAATINVTDAAAGAADSLNLVLSKAGVLAAGTVTAADVETLAITATNTTKDALPGAVTDTLTLVATSATSATVSGNANLVLTNTGNVALTTINASTMTGALTVTAFGATANTITGGSGNDKLTASTGVLADTLVGGAGNDTLTANAGLTKLTGGTGNDTFVITTPSANVNSYSTITDATAGDKIQLVAMGVETFQKSAVVLGDTAVFQDYANAAINAAGDASTDGYIAWFQFGGNTYIIETTRDTTAAPEELNFQNGEDIIVKLTGLVDLSTASFSTDTPTLQIV